MTTINPSTPTIPNAIELDAVLNILQTALSGVSWIEKAFNRATIHNDPVKGLTPKVYQGSQQYFDVLHNDSLKAHSFFYTTSEEFFFEYIPGQQAGRKYRDVSLFVLGNLREIDGIRDYIYTTKLKKDIEDVLLGYEQVVINSIQDQNPNEIFREFEINDKHRELLMYPKFALRFNLTISYEEVYNCE